MAKLGRNSYGGHSEPIRRIGEGTCFALSAEPKRARRYALPLAENAFFGVSQNGRIELEKRSYFGGPCLEGTLRNPNADRGETQDSESSPVAGTIKGETALSNFRCRTATRVAKSSG